MRFVKTVAIAATAAAVMLSAGGERSGQARSYPARRAFPSTTAVLGPAQARVVEMMKTLSGGSLDVRFFEPGALMPASQYFYAMSNGRSTWRGRWPVSSPARTRRLRCSLRCRWPEAGEYLAWMRYGGGEQLQKELHAKYNIEVITCGWIAPEASGWFRKEIKSVDDLKGLKMRFFGLGAIVMQKLGVSTQILQAGEIFQALQLGTIDATEFSMPVMDMTLGFHQVAKHYYFPGWHQMSTLNHLYVSKTKWAELSATQKAIIKAACDANMLEQFAEGEAKQFGAMKELQAKGVTLHYWPKEILAAYEKTWNEVAIEQAAKSPEFKKAWESYSAFRTGYKLWRDYGYLKQN